VAVTVAEALGRPNAVGIYIALRQEFVSALQYASPASLLHNYCRLLVYTTGCQKRKAVLARQRDGLRRFGAQRECAVSQKSHISEQNALRRNS